MRGGTDRDGVGLRERLTTVARDLESDIGREGTYERAEVAILFLRVASVCGRSHLVLTSRPGQTISIFQVISATFHLSRIQVGSSCFSAARAGLEMDNHASIRYRVPCATRAGIWTCGPPL
jgi:hypothetical protein